MSLIKEPFASMADSLEKKCLGLPESPPETTRESNNGNLLIKVMSLTKSPTKSKLIKHVIGTLPDQHILRMLETAMEEMVLFEANQGQFKYPTQDFKDYFYHFLLKQYGLEKMARGY